MKKKILVFHPAIAPYRIDLFNSLNESFHTNFYFYSRNLQNQKFDQSKILSQLNFKPNYLTSGINLIYKERVIRFGYLNKIILHKPDILICSEYSIITIVSIIFTKLFFRKTKVYTMCDDSLDVSNNTMGFRKIARYFCTKYLYGVLLGNNIIEEWYKVKYPKLSTVVIPIIQNENRLRNSLRNSQQYSQFYNKQFKLENKTVYLFVGRFVAVKNLKYLIEQFSQFINEKKNKDYILILVGSGELHEDLKNLVKNLNIKEYVIFAGRYENEELYAWYYLADYLVLSSISETFGAVVNEALISGVPVICSKLAGASSLINEKNGILFNPNKKNDLLESFRNSINKLPSKRKMNSLRVSLMPFSFDERKIQLINFLNIN